MQHVTLAATATLESHRAPIHIGSVHLHVRDLDRVSRFYQQVVGLEVIDADSDVARLGNDGVVLLVLERNVDATPASLSAPGLFHTAFVLPERRHLGLWLRTATTQGWRIEGAADHLVSEAVYLSDPEGNGIEIYRDRPRSDWPRDGERLRMANAPLDIKGLIAAAGEGEVSAHYRLPPGARIGHVHLKVADLAEASAVIGTAWGFAETCRFPGAAFFGSGGYHHQLAANVWSADGRPRPPGLWLGLRDVVLQATDADTYADLAARWRAVGGEADGDGIRLKALGGIGFALRPPST